MTQIPIQVYGINLLIKLMSEGPADVRVHCPKGSPILYGEVIARGDGSPVLRRSWRAYLRWRWASVRRRWTVFGRICLCRPSL